MAEQRDTDTITRVMNSVRHSDVIAQGKLVLPSASLNFCQSLNEYDLATRFRCEKCSINFASLTRNFFYSSVQVILAIVNTRHTYVLVVRIMFTTCQSHTLKCSVRNSNAKSNSTLR